MMRHLLLAAVAAATLATPALSRKLDINNPVDVVQIDRKIGCSTKDGEAKVFHWSGRAYSRVNGERDRHIFNVEGMNVRQCATVTDPKRGVGYRMVSRELMLYLDPKTNEVLRTWNNPWTGKPVEVLHVANDPVNMRAPSFPYGADGKPAEFEGRIVDGRVYSPFEAPLFYPNPLAGEYQEYVGNHYHAMEIFDFISDEKVLLDSKTTTANAAVAWVRIADWLPWMEMGSRDGLMVVNAMGDMLGSFEELPAVLKDEIAKNYPDYKVPPPLDDARPNETSWTYFKKHIDAKRAAAKAAAK
jgi:Protein of unknown function (DUF1838)